MNTANKIRFMLERLNKSFCRDQMVDMENCERVSCLKSVMQLTFNDLCKLQKEMEPDYPLHLKVYSKEDFCQEDFCIWDNIEEIGND